MIKRIVLALAIAISSTGIAQETTVSPYSFNGLGELRLRGTHENRSMGEISVYSDSIHLNLQDPSAYGGLKLTNYSLGVNYTGTRLESNEASVDDQTASIDYLAIAFPVSKGVGVGFGLSPRTAVGYRLQTGSTNTDFGEEREQLDTYLGEGGLNKIFLSTGFAIVKGLKFGLSGGYSFGSVENTNVRLIEGIEFGTQDLYESNLYGFDFTAALSYQRPVGNKLFLASNVIYTPESNLTSENSQTISRVQNLGSVGDFSQEIDLGARAETELTIPSSLSFGLGVGQEKKWFMGANYTMDENSNFTDRFFNVNDNVIFEDATKVSLGGFYIPKYDSFTSYWSRVVYRLGLRYEETGLNINGSDVNDFGISFGIGLPITRNFSNVNLGFELGRRGTKNVGLIQEDYFNIRLSVSLNDRWFQKRKYN